MEIVKDVLLIKYSTKLDKIVSIVMADLFLIVSKDYANHVVIFIKLMNKELLVFL
jgi:hypothetical protein